MKILIVDDAPDILTWLSALLVKAGWEVIEAADGIGACEYLESMDIRIVITDWMMPGMDGLSLIEWIRARNEHRYIYTILMTSRNEQRDCVQGLSVGADDYLTKPVASTILHARLSVAQRILQMQEELLTQQSRLRESRDLVTRTYARVREDIKNAAVVQKSRLPYNGLAARSISTAWCYRPAMGVDIAMFIARPDPFDQAETIHTGHHPVGNDNPYVHGLQVFTGTDAIRSFYNFPTGFYQ